MTITDWIQAISATAVGIVTVFLWLLARRQTDLLESSVEIARLSAESARRSAEVAERALVGVQRPLLRLEVTKLEIKPNSSRANFADYAATLIIRNIGREPAIIIDSAVQFLPTVPRIQPPLPGARPFDRVWSITDLDDGLVVTSDGSTTFRIERTMDANDGERLENFQSMRGALFIYGIIIYDDPIGFRRELGFTFAYDATTQQFDRCAFEGHHFDRIIDHDLNTIRLEALNS